MPIPQPQDWSRAYARVQGVADRSVLAALRKALEDVNRMLRQIDPALGRVGDLVRIEQLQTVKRNLLNEQSKIFNRMGDIISERRAQAALQATILGSSIDDVLFGSVGQSAVAQQLRNSMTAGLNQTIDVAITRMTISAVPLAERIYNSNVWANGVLQRRINSALLRGLSAAEFAKEARAWFDPSVPGGTRYAASRLARTEINNAFHATSVIQAQEKPWIQSMKWHLSRSHPKPDTCDQLAKGGPKGDGVYPKMEVPRKPHPQCFCFVTPVSPDEDDFLDALVSGKYDNYLRQKMAGTARVPESTPTKVSPAKPAQAIKKAAPPAELPPPIRLPRVSAELDNHFSDINKVQGPNRERVKKALVNQGTYVPKTMRQLGDVRDLQGVDLDHFRALYGHDAAGGYFFDARRIAMTPDVLAKNYDALFKKELKSKWSSRCGHDGLGSFMAHECGHHVDNILSGNRALQKRVWDAIGAELGQRGPFSMDLQSLDRYVVQHKPELTNLVSRYGVSDSRELIAEIWAEYTTNPRARDHIKRIGRIIQAGAEEAAS